MESISERMFKNVFIFTAGDYWFIDAVSGIPETQNPIRTSMARRY